MKSRQMGKMSLHDLKRHSIITDLKKLGVERTPAGDGLHGLDYHELKFIYTMELVRREG